MASSRTRNAPYVSGEWRTSAAEPVLVRVEVRARRGTRRGRRHGGTHRPGHPRL